MIAPQAAFPLFIVARLDRAKDYYTHYFGFQVVFENEWYLHLAAATGIQVGFMLPKQLTQPDEFKTEYGGAGVIFSLEVDDADAAYAFAQSQGLDIFLTLRSEAWGQRHFSLRDPNGVYLDVVQAIEPAAEYQAGYTA